MSSTVVELAAELERVREHIQYNDLHRATNMMVDLTRNHDQRRIRNQALALTTRFTALRDQQRIVGHDECAPAINQLVIDLLGFIDEIEQIEAESIAAEQRGAAERRANAVAADPAAALPMPPKAPTSRAAPAETLAAAGGTGFGAELLRHRSLGRSHRSQNRRNGETAYRGRNVRFKFPGGGTEPFGLAWEEVEFKFGEITAVVGPNGAGKTTFLKIIAGELATASGFVEYPAFRSDPIDWYAVRQTISYVSQRGWRWPGTMIDNLRFEASIFGHRGVANDDEVDFIIRRLRLDEYAGRAWDELSGGFRTRFELARALLREPRILVLDEPLAHLDPNVQALFLQDLYDLTRWSDRPSATIISSQHLHEVETIADRVIFVSNGELRFMNDTADTAQSKTTRLFEIISSQNGQDLREILESLGVLNITETALCITIEMPQDISSDIFLRHVMSREVNISYFRETTSSTKRLFQ